MSSRSPPTWLFSSRGRPFRDHQALVDHRDAVGEPVGLVEDLRGEQHRRAPRDERLDRIPELDAAADVQSGGRLVEEQDRRPGDQRGGQVEAAAHPARIGANETVGGVGEVEGGQQLPRPGTRLPSREVVEPADHLEVLEAGQVLVHRGVLAGEPDVLAHPGGVADDVEARHARGAVVGQQQGRQDADGRRLAGAVRAEQPEDAARLDVKVDAAKRVDVAVALSQPTVSTAGSPSTPSTLAVVRVR